MTKTRSSLYINESLSLLKTTTNHHAHSLQEINQQLNAKTQQLNGNTQQLNAISLALQKLTEVEEQRQQVASLKSSSQTPSTPISHVVSLPISNLSKSVKLDFSQFKGDDPASWLYKANQYFNFYQMPLSERLLMASFHINGVALIWFQDSEETGLFATWEDFVEALLTRFESTAYEDPMESFTRLKSGSVMVYKGQFELLSNRIRGLLDGHKLSCFLSGLKDEVRLPVKMLNPKNLNEAFGLAKIQEEYLNSSRRG